MSLALRPSWAWPSVDLRINFCRVTLRSARRRPAVHPATTVQHRWRLARLTAPGSGYTSVGDPKDKHRLGARQSVFCVGGFSGPTRARYCAFNPISSHLGILSRGWSRDVATLEGG